MTTTTTGAPGATETETETTAGALATTTTTAAEAEAEALALARIARTQDLSLDQLAIAARRSLLLADCSGSMDGYISTGGRKIDALRKIVADLQSEHSVPCAAFGITPSARGGSSIRLLDAGARLPEPDGLTPIAEAIDYGRQQGADHLVLITDGIPDSEADAFNAARRFNNPIDCFYIGDGKDRGAIFCNELARMTGGSANLADLTKPKELQGKIRLMIGDGSGI